MDADHIMLSTSTHDDEQRSSLQQVEISTHERDHGLRSRLRSSLHRSRADSNDTRDVQNQPKDRNLQAHSSKTLKLEHEAQIRSIRTQMTDQFNEVLKCKESQGLDVQARLERELAFAQDSFKRCQTDLWRLQPLPQVTDAEILTDFDELCHRVSSWIDEEIAIYEKLDGGSKQQALFHDGGDKVLASYMREFPAFGEYYVAYIVHSFLCSKIFNTKTYLVGLPSATVRVLKVVEEAMPHLKPPRDKESIVFWRSEALTAFCNTKNYDRSKARAEKRLTGVLLSELLVTIPVLARDLKASSHRLQRSILAPATKLAIKMHTSKSKYQVRIGAAKIGHEPELTMERSKHFPFFDVRTRRPIKATSRAIIAQKGRLGSIIMPIEPFVGRVSNDGTIKELRTNTFLVALD